MTTQNEITTVGRYEVHPKVGGGWAVVGPMGGVRSKHRFYADAIAVAKKIDAAASTGETTMTTYQNLWIVTRHGSNAANQSMTETAILGTVEAESEVEAKKLAGDTFYCYANQFLGLESFDSATAEDCNLAGDADYGRSQNKWVE